MRLGVIFLECPRRRALTIQNATLAAAGVAFSVWHNYDSTDRRSRPAAPLWQWHRIGQRRQVLVIAAAFGRATNPRRRRPSLAARQAGLRRHEFAILCCFCIDLFSTSDFVGSANRTAVLHHRVRFRRLPRQRHRGARRRLRVLARRAVPNAVSAVLQMAVLL